MTEDALLMHRCPGSPEDVDLQLLRLYVSQSSSSPKQPPAFTAGGTSPDPLDARLAWVLTTVLAAVGALPPAVANSSQVRGDFGLSYSPPSLATRLFVARSHLDCKRLCILVGICNVCQCVRRSQL
jgi:hypothetical protein